MEAAEIGNIGERYVANWLTSKGYSGIQNTQLPGSTDIEAHTSTTKILVQVKTAVVPYLPAGLSADERDAIVSRANRLGRQAWLAQVQINSQRLLIGEIKWTKLN
jgi:Holliday junction resolvase-like predicted endonuclease